MSNKVVPLKNLPGALHPSTVAPRVISPFENRWAPPRWHVLSQLLVGLTLPDEDLEELTHAVALRLRIKDAEAACVTLPLRLPRGGDGDTVVLTDADRVGESVLEGDTVAD